jgi:hypothetical protein
MTTLKAYTDWRFIADDLSLNSTYLVDLLDLWKGKIRDGKIPSRSDFRAEEFLQFGGRVVLIDVEQHPYRFRYRLIGTHITKALGRDSTGKYLDEIYDSDFYDKAVETYRKNVEEMVPFRAHGEMVHAFKPYLSFEAIDIPLSDDGKAVNMILKGSEFISLDAKI